MSGFFSKLLHCSCSFRIPGDPRKVDTGYVSEFSGFMDHYLVDHPEVVADQKVGRLLYWDKRIDLGEQAKAERDSVPEDGYGFNSVAWRHAARH